MNEWKVTNHDLSLRLRELGVRQDVSELVWALRENGAWEKWRSAHAIGVAFKDVVAAYDGSELGVMVGPHGYVFSGADCWYWHAFADLRDPVGPCKTYAIACAAMLVWLLESGHVTPDEVNGRLECTG